MLKADAGTTGARTIGAALRPVRAAKAAAPAADERRAGGDDEHAAADVQAAARRKPATDVAEGAARVAVDAPDLTASGAATGTARGTAAGAATGTAAAKSTDQPAPVDPGTATPKPASADPHDAGNLDAAVPTAKRTELLASQAKATSAANDAALLAHHTGDDPAAVRRASLATYYAAHPYYVDAATGKVFAATYDESTGVLHGQRTGDDLVNPHAKLDRDRKVTQGADEHAQRAARQVAQQAQEAADRVSRAARRGASPGQLASAAGGHPQPFVADAAASSGADGATGLAVEDAAAGFGNFVGPFESDPVDSTVDVDSDGVSTLTQSRSAGGKDERSSLTQVVHADGSGAIVDARRQTDDQASASDRSKATRNVLTWGAGGVQTGDTTDVSSAGARQQVTHHTSKTFANDQVAHVQEQWVATDDVSTATETHETDFEGGNPSHGTVERQAQGQRSSWFPITVTQKDTIEYGADGRPTKIDSDYPDDQRDVPDLLLASAHEGRDDQPFFALGRVENRPSTDDKGTAHPGSLAGPGATVRHSGVLVTVEGADATDAISRDSSLYQTGPDGNANQRDATAKFAYALDTIDHTPEELRSTTRQVRYELQSNDGAYAWSTQNKSLVFFGGNTGSAETMWHEMAHAADGKDGAPDDATWRTAAEKDSATREALLAKLPAGTTVQATNPDLLDKELGTDAYGTHGPSGGDLSRAEDWAEATSLFLQDRRDGGLATATLPDGSTQEIRYADLYPERTKILTTYYHDFPGWQVPDRAARRVDTTRFPPVKQTADGGTAGTMGPWLRGSIGGALGGNGSGLGGGASSSTGGATMAPSGPASNAPQPK